jgi:hypothetical protein
VVSLDPSPKHGGSDKGQTIIYEHANKYEAINKHIYGHQVKA